MLYLVKPSKNNRIVIGICAVHNRCGSQCGAKGCQYKAKFF